MDGSPCAGTGEPVDGLAVAATAFLPRLLSLLAVLAGAMAVGCGSVLVLRKLAGAIAAPPSPQAALAVCGAGLLLVAVGDLAMRSSAVRASGPAVSWLPAVLTRLGLLMAMAALVLPLRMTSPMDALTTIATLVVSLVAVIRGPVAELIRDRLVQGRPAALNRASVPRAAAVPPSTAVPTAVLSHPTPRARLEEATMPAPPAGNLLQRFERLALPDGGECVCGRLCVVVPAGSRNGYAHVGFCPPLASQPTVEVTTDYDGVEAVVSAAEVLPWGARIECRLDEPAEETVEIPVDILAKSPF
jgi:hypothetical protein